MGHGDNECLVLGDEQLNENEVWNIMKNVVLAAAVATSLVMSGCQTREEATLAGGLVGGSIGAVTAAALGASSGWIVASSIAAGTVGALYARNRHTNECAYSNGDGTYTIRRCPG